MQSELAENAAGSVSQVRTVTAQLTRFAKETGTIVLIVGHVTKDGLIAGPRVLEHIVDTVLYFEGEPHEDLRLLRSVKNRFIELCLFSLHFLLHFLRLSHQLLHVASAE